ncbi:MAG: methyl-accepting chemotaxis protein [Treponema sp.]|nr:methyl-accepting chemotaxis protein [Treponema sp.]
MDNSESLNLQAKKIKIPVYLKLIQILLFLFPSAYFQLFLIFTGRVKDGIATKISSSPFMLFYQTLYLGLTIFFCYITWTLFKKFDGSLETTKKVNKKFKFIAFGTMTQIVINSWVYPLVFSTITYRLGSNALEYAPTLFISIGETLMFGMLFYLIWLSGLEKIMRFVPFQKKDIVISFTLKNILVAAFSTVALIMLTSYPLLTSSFADLSLSEIFIKKCLPMAITGLVVIPLDFLILTNISVSRIKDINKFTKVLGEGDFTQNDLEVITRDDFGVLALSINKFQAATKQLLKGMGDSIAVSTEAANSSFNTMQDISSSTNQMISNIQEIQNQMNDQTSSVEESTGAINEILSNIKGLNDSIEQQSAAVEQSSAAVNEMVANIQSVTNILEKNEMSTNQLAEASGVGQEKVTEAVNLAKQILGESKTLIEASSVIQNIATQTNLLAMNAAIEAAHAGDAGKGFAVVADEIRKLAEQSNIQGKKITESLKNLEAVIGNVATSTTQLQEQFTTIFELTKIVKQQEDVVMSAMKEQAEGSNQILLAMHNIDDITGNVKEGSAEMLAGGNQLVKEMELLNEATARTNNNINEMANGADVIIHAVEKGNDATALNNESIQSLVTEMNKFKLR